ncbi:MAG: DUF1524 domain-containing protein, partial [Candidatus Omnitrophica bacterium]|nr:DUF1524 domain-containing protein [Candidatus Omnitrophota bacterium]
IDIVIVKYFQDTLNNKQQQNNKWNDATWKQICKDIFIINESGRLGENRGRELLRKLFKDFWKSKKFFIDSNKEKEFKEDFKNRCKEDNFKGNNLLWLSIYQKLPVKTKGSEFEIDHILPKEWIEKKKWMNIKKHINKFKNEVYGLGNLWLVDAQTNNKWLDKVSPKTKFKKCENEKDREEILKGEARDVTYADLNKLKDQYNKIKDVEDADYKKEFLTKIEDGKFRGALINAYKTRKNKIISTTKKTLGLK